MVSPATLEHACPTSISRDVLRLTVTDPLWMSELTYFLPSFLQAFNDVLPEGEKLREIRLRMGQVPARRHAGPAPDARSEPVARPVDTSALPGRIRDRLARISDPELRDLVTRMASTLSTGRH